MVLPSEDAARAVLKRFADLKVHSGNVLEGNHLISLLSKHPMSSNDLANGLEFAQRTGWIKMLDYDNFELTDAGQAEMRGDNT